RPHDAAVDERALADARWSDDGQQRLFAQAVEQRRGLALTAEEERGVVGREWLQATIRRAIGQKVRALRWYLFEDVPAHPVPERIVSDLERWWPGHEARALPPGAGEHEQLFWRTGRRCCHLEKRPQRGHRNRVTIDDRDAAFADRISARRQLCTRRAP